MGRKVENFRNKQGFIDLNKLKRFRENGVVVEGSNAKCWFNFGGERFLFKEYDNLLSVFGEVLYYRIARECGVDCAQYDFALFDGKKGTISFDFLKKNETYYSFLELTSEFGENNLDLEDITTNRELLVMQNNKYNNLISIKSLINRLFRIPMEQKKEIERGGQVLIVYNRVETIYDFYGKVAKLLGEEGSKTKMESFIGEKSSSKNQAIVEKIVAESNVDSEKEFERV